MCCCCLAVRVLHQTSPHLLTFVSPSHISPYLNLMARGIRHTVMKAKFGPEKATPIITYAVMKAGMKSVDANGRVGAIKSHKAQKRMDDYLAGVRRVTHPEGEEDEENEDLEEEDQELEQALNEQDLYRNLGKEIPAATLRLSASQQNGTGSSHIGSESTNDDIGDHVLGDQNLDDNNGSNNSPSENQVSE